MKKIYVVEYMASHYGTDIRYISRSKIKADNARDEIAQGYHSFKQNSDGDWKCGGDMIATCEYVEDEIVVD